MCTILLAWRHLPGFPIVLAANRDEFLARPSLPPRLLRESPPRIAGGQDLLARGTWLAVREDGVVAAVTNRRAETRDPTRRSRGDLPLALLDAPDPSAFVHALNGSDYNPFNLLYAGENLALVAEAHDDGVRVERLTPGLHVVTVHDLDDLAQPKVHALCRRFEAIADAAGDDAHALLDGMEELLTDHGEPGREGPEAACVHMDPYGTVSSSSVVVDDRGRITYRHAQGKPCVTAHDDVRALLAPAGRPTGQSSG